MPSTTYPVAIDSLSTTYTGTEDMGVVDHAGTMHNLPNSAINAIETYLGTNRSQTTPANQGNLLVASGASSSSWSSSVVSVSSDVLTLTGSNGSNNNNTQLRFHGYNAAVDVWAVGLDVAAANGSKDFHIYDLVAPGPKVTISQGSGNPVIVNSGGLQVTAGNVGIGGAPVANAAITVQGTAASSGGYAVGGMDIISAVDSSTTNNAWGIHAKVTTSAASYTLSTLYEIAAANPTKGAGSTISTLVGVYVESMTAGSTNNYGIYVNTPSGGSGTNQVIGSASGGYLSTAGVWTNASHEFVSGQQFKLHKGNGSEPFGGSVLDTLKAITVHHYDVTGEWLEHPDGPLRDADGNVTDERKWRVADHDQKDYIGFFAEELYALSPLLSRDGKGVDAVSIGAFNTLAIQALLQRIEKVEAKVFG